MVGESYVKKGEHNRIKARVSVLNVCV